MTKTAENLQVGDRITDDYGDPTTVLAPPIVQTHSSGAVEVEVQTAAGTTWFLLGTVVR